MSEKEGSKRFYWDAYLNHFDYFSPEAVRDGCYPRIMEHQQDVKKAIVLVHGLSDSPHFVSYIGDFFHNELNYNVYMPLLHCHGLRYPKGMEGVELEEWERNIRYALDCAETRAESISIGGLSTGGTLSLHMANARPGVNGTLYLFSAALDLAGGFRGLLGEMKEKLLKTFLVDLLDRNKPLVGDNPYRYSHVDLDGARELARLIKHTDTLVRGFSKAKPFPMKVFAAHSEADTTAHIDGIDNLLKVCDPNKSYFMRFAKGEGIAHASLVLKNGISDVDKPEKANPKFNKMMQAIKSFEQTG